MTTPIDEYHGLGSSTTWNVSMQKQDGIRIIHYDAERIPDDRPGWRSGAKKFWVVRQSIVTTCRRHGLVGPDDRAEYDDYVYWVVDDQYNNERYQYLEICKPSGMTRAWLLDLMRTLEDHAHWVVGISSIGEGYILVFPGCLMVTGPTFKSARTIDEVVDRAIRALELEEIIRQTNDDASLEALSRIPGIEKKAFALRDLERVTDGGLVHVSRLIGITRLVLDRSPITDRGLASLNALRNLEDLSLQETAITGQGFRHLRDLPKLKEIFLGGCRLSDEGLRHLAELKHLERIDLTGGSVTDETAVVLKGMQTLKQLRVGACLIGDRAMSNLRGLAALEELDLGGTQVTDAGLVHLEKLRNLKRLDLKGTHVTSKGVKRLQKALPECEINSGPM